jgi:alpha-L-fucosidase
VNEILTQYGDICLVWFDTPREMNAARAKRLHDIVRELQPKCLIDGRLGGGPDLSDYDSEGDNRIPGEVRRGDWETPATLNDTWGYKSYDNNWKKPDDLVFKLVDIVSKGGNYLLNVGPTAEGVIPEPSQEALRAVGKWLKVNGEAVYGCGPTPFGPELGKATDQKDQRGRVIYDVYKDWRCTTKGDKLYFHLFKWPGSTFEVPMARRLSRVYMLADASQTSLAVKQEPGKTTISLPPKPMSDYASVVVVELSQ